MKTWMEAWLPVLLEATELDDFELELELATEELELLLEELEEATELELDVAVAGLYEHHAEVEVGPSGKVVLLQTKLPVIVL
jgi:hypothetical protein